MNIAGTRVDGTHQDRTDQPHNRCIFVFLDRDNVLLARLLGFVQLLDLDVDNRLSGRHAFIEAAIQRGENVAPQRHDGVDLVARNQLGFGDRVHVVRRDHGQRHRAAFDGNWCHQTLAAKCLWDQTDYLRIYQFQS